MGFLDFIVAAGKYAAQHKKEVAGVGVALAFTAVSTYALTSKKKNRVYMKLMEEHDRDTARKIRDEFQKKYDELLLKANETNMKKQQLEESIKTLCHEFGIDPKLIL